MFLSCHNHEIQQMNSNPEEESLNTIYTILLKGGQIRCLISRHVQEESLQGKGRSSFIEQEQRKEITMNK
jgi:hypothetical protein